MRYGQGIELRMNDKIYTKKDLDEMADSVVLFAKIFLGFNLDRENTELMRRFIDVSAQEIRENYAMMLDGNNSVWDIEKDKKK